MLCRRESRVTDATNKRHVVYQDRKRARAIKGIKGRVYDVSRAALIASTAVSKSSIYSYTEIIRHVLSIKFYQR